MILLYNLYIYGHFVNLTTFFYCVGTRMMMVQQTQVIKMGVRDTQDTINVSSEVQSLLHQIKRRPGRKKL